MTRGDIPWSGSEAATVHEFLSGPVGSKWLRVLEGKKPKIDVTSTDKAALTGAVSAGYELVFLEIASTRKGPTPREDASAKGIDPTKD
jgi:hypothetical protein